MASKTVQRRAWWMVWTSAAAMVLGVNALILTPYGILIKPIGEETGWSRSVVTGALSLYALTAAVVTPFMGALLDKHGFRKVVAPGIVATSGLMCVLGVVPASVGVWFLLMGVLGVVSSVQNPVPYVKIAAQWVDGRRGLALGIIAVGGALGVALVPPYVGALLELGSWRVAFIGLGGLLLVIGLPLVLGVLREPRADEIEHLDVRLEQGGELPGLELREAVRTRSFWQLLLAVVLFGSAIPGVVVQMTPLLTDGGLSLGRAIGVVSLMSIAMLVGHLVGGYLLDKVHAPFLACAMFAAPIPAFVLLTVDGLGYGLAVAAGLLIGLANGVESDLVSYMVSRYLGIKRFGRIYGVFMAILALGYAIGPLVYAGVGGYLLVVITGTPLTIALLVWSVWYAVRRLANDDSTEPERPLEPLPQ